MGIASATGADPWGVYGRSSGSNGIGVNGAAWSTEGEAYGGSFYSHSPDGAGIRATATATTGTPFGGEFYANHPTQGAAVKAEAPAFGVHSTSTATSGTAFGGWFKSTSTEGRAVHGTVTATTGENYGGYFVSASDHGVGVYGHVSISPTSGDYIRGVLGEASMEIDGGTSIGVEGRGFYGVRGRGGHCGGSFSNDASSSWAFIGYSTYKVSGSGSVSFIQNHPAQNNRVIVYACPEGDEVATYTRGTARLKNGKALVDLGETFKWVTNPETGLTAHITPRGEWADLYVKSVTTEELVVASRDGIGDTRFDYMVYGLRIGFEDVSIVQEKTRESYIPAMSFHEEQYAKHPDLRQYSAKSRFAAMESRIDAAHPKATGAAQSLLDKIGMYDPIIHSNRDMLRNPLSFSGTTLTGN
jgi:hypothetical protein